MSDSKRILYIGQLNGTCASRMRVLQNLGCEVVPFDTMPYVTYPRRLIRAIAHRYNMGPPVKDLNRDLMHLVETQDTAITHVWIDKGVWISPETLHLIKRTTGAVLVHYTPDPQFLFCRSVHFESSIPLYDALFTTKPFELDYYRQRGGRNVFLVHQSYDNTKLYPRELSFDERSRFSSDFCFIGHRETHYVECLKAARNVEGRLRIWGPGWRKYARIHGWAQSIVSGDGIWGDDYARALNATSIGLCFLSKRYPETTTTRTFEIPGCRTFMLAERTEHHLALFEEGKEAEFFSNADELVDKIRYYLCNPAQRQQIAAAGYERCLRSGYSDHNRMRQMLQVVEELKTDQVESR
jgi:spore maturation protein CgeB